METDGDRGAVEAMIPLSKLPLRDGNYGPHVEVIVSGETFETSSEGWKLSGLLHGLDHRIPFRNFL